MSQAVGAQSWNEKSRASIAHHAKSFYWASLFLPQETFDDVCHLYAFCRWIDDVADTQAPDVAALELSRIEAQLAGVEPPGPFMAEILALFARRGIRRDYARELVRGAQSDLLEVRIRNDREFLTYCYRVAGTVGLMMRPLIGVTDPRADRFAVDLGIAMQITNICRDVMEDARRGRIYLPEARLRAAGLHPELVQRLEVSPARLGEVVRDLLALADLYYESGRQGFAFIPARTRLSILIASRIYQAIGLRLRIWRYNPLRGRAMVPTWAKLGWTLRALVEFLGPRYRVPETSASHNALLHVELQGLPGIDS